MSSGQVSWCQQTDATETRLSPGVERDYERLAGAIDDMGVELWVRANQANASAVVNGVVLEDRPLAMDWIPRLIGPAEWSRVALGVEQRMRAFLAFLRAWRDGTQRSVPDPLMRPYSADQRSELPVDLHVYAPDLIRDKTGDLLVIEDNLGHPAAQYFAATIRSYQHRHFPELVNAVGSIHEPDPFGTLLRRALEKVAGDEGEYVWLWPGRNATPAWVEVAALAEEAGCRVVTPDEVRIDWDGALVHVDGGRRIDAVHVQLWDGDPANDMLRDVAAAGRTAVLSGHHDRLPGDKGILPYVPAMIRELLGEEPVLGQAPSVWFGESGAITRVFGEIRNWVLKRRIGVGGSGVLIGRNATRDELSAWRRAIERQPGAFVAQQFVEGSTLWSLDAREGNLVSRFIDLRAYAIRIEQPRTVRLGLTRRTPPDSYRTSLLQSQAALKDTWILEGNGAN